MLKVLFLACIGCTHKGTVKVCIVCDQYCILWTKSFPHLQSFCFQRRILDHRIGDSSKRGNFFRDMPFWIYEGIENIDDLAIFDLHRTDFSDALLICRKPGRLQVENDKLSIEILLSVPLDRRYHIVDKVSFDTIDHAEILPALRSIHGIRESLHNAVIGDCHSAVSPVMSHLCKVCRAIHSIHGRHIGVQVQLDTFDWRIVCLFLLLNHGNGIWSDGNIMLILVKCSISADNQGIALF